MPAHVLVIPYPNFRVSRQLLLAFVSAMREARLHHVLIDMRPVAPTPFLENRRWAVAGDAQSALAEERVALVVPQDEHESFGGIERVAGANIRTFADFEAAIRWLTLQEQAAI